MEWAKKQTIYTKVRQRRCRPQKMARGAFQLEFRQESAGRRPTQPKTPPVSAAHSTPCSTSALLSSEPITSLSESSVDCEANATNQEEGRRYGASKTVRIGKQMNWGCRETSLPRLAHLGHLPTYLPTYLPRAHSKTMRILPLTWITQTIPCCDMSQN